MKNNKLLTTVVAALALAGSIGCIALADTTGCIQTLSSVMTTGSNSCCGKYYAYVKMTNSAGTYWIKPPTNAVSGTLTDISGFPAPYASSAVVWPFGSTTPICASNSVTFQATNSMYQLQVVVNSPTPPPTNGQPMTIQINWH